MVGNVLPGKILSNWVHLRFLYLPAARSFYGYSDFPVGSLWNGLPHTLVQNEEYERKDPAARVPWCLREPLIWCRVGSQSLCAKRTHPVWCGACVCVHVCGVVWRLCVGACVRVCVQCALVWECVWCGACVCPCVRMCVLG